MIAFDSYESEEYKSISNMEVDSIPKEYVKPFIMVK
jgi:hypothetical protein